MITANAVLLSNDSIDLSPYGIDTVKIDKADSYLAKSNPSVLAAHCAPHNYKTLVKLLLSEQKKNRHKRFIIFHDDLSTQQISEINNQVHPSRVLSFEETDKLPEIFEACFDKYYELEQSKKLIELVNEKNEELKRLTTALENKVEERQEHLEDSRQKNLAARKRLETLKQTLVHIYQASSISEIEKGIAQALKKEFNIAWVHIRRPSQSNLTDRGDDLKFYKVTLKADKKDFGHLLFFRDDGQSFSQKEKRFLSQVADAVSLSIERTFQYQKSQELKRQWEATFDAISDPICLTDENYNILRINASFLKKTETTDYKDHLGQKCYQSLFGRETPCEGCRRGAIFQIRNPAQNKQLEVFDVYSNNLGEKQQAVYFQMYRDVTQDLNLQRQVIESAKMAELGTISSSIAHELNNPIGGMLNFIQLMKMDLEGNEDFYSDLLEIEKGIIKCKNIVKNLLGFARKSFNSEIQEVNLNEVIEQAIKITELKTRSIGINIDYSCETDEFFIPGRFNLLTHAVRNILQNSQESLVQKRKNDKSFVGKIGVKLFQFNNELCIEICDNGDGIQVDAKDKIFDPLFTTKDPETNSGLGLTLALQIVEEHKGSISVSIDKDKKLCFKLSFSKSEA